MIPSILAMAAVSAALRVFPLIGLSGRTFSPSLREAIDHLPPALLSAMLARDWVSSGGFSLEPESIRYLIATAVAAAVMIRVRSLAWTTIAGMAFLTLARHGYLGL